MQNGFVSRRVNLVDHAVLKIAASVGHAVQISSTIQNHTAVGTISIRRTMERVQDGEGLRLGGTKRKQAKSASDESNSCPVRGRPTNNEVMPQHAGWSLTRIGSCGW